MRHRKRVLPFTLFVQFETGQRLGTGWPKPPNSNAEATYIPEQASAQMTCNYSKVVSRICFHHGAVLLFNLNHNRYQLASLVTF